MKVGIALAGGGARGFAHIGVLAVLERLKVKIDFIAGTSMGAIIGGLYTLDPCAERVKEKVGQFIQKYSEDLAVFKNYSAEENLEENKKLFEKSFHFVKKLALWNIRIIKPYLINPKVVLQILREMFKEYKFDNCKIPFICPAVDLVTGKPFFMEEGFLYKAVAASSLLPGIFPPLKLKGKMLVDGGVLLPLPAAVLKSKVDFIIGVNLDRKYVQPVEVKNVIDVISLVERIKYKEILRNNLKEVDFVVEPKVFSYSWADFDKYEELVALGKEAMVACEEKLIRALKRKKWRSLFSLGSILPRKGRKKRDNLVFTKFRE